MTPSPTTIDIRIHSVTRRCRGCGAGSARCTDGIPLDPLPGQILSADPADDREDRAPLVYQTVAWSGDPIGKVLLSNTGNALGKLTEMHVGADGVVIEIADDKGHTYAGDRLLTVGSYAAIVTAADYEQQVQAGSHEWQRQQLDRQEELTPSRLTRCLQKRVGPRIVLPRPRRIRRVRICVPVISSTRRPRG